MTQETLPGAAGDLAELHPEIWAAYSELGAAIAASGDLSEREKRLVKLALAIGAGSEGAVHSHARRAMDENIPTVDLYQIAFLAIGPLGFPRSVAGWTWIKDVTANT
ncbi:carboxymuconolactone decarboxylase family protein [Pacificoceanicola onchidii]|uniref:carboxymuconolactone decarboxylase family protein n=1 Tax=Pacificoceanicola onchidii TaxID=2562685 RepID=UPI0010A44E83|nr:carboxymuconolactone decarboxylase family protein [Pacificoceanicola onchidii]